MRWLKFCALYLYASIRRAPCSLIYIAIRPVSAGGTCENNEKFIRFRCHGTRLGFKFCCGPSLAWLAACHNAVPMVHCGRVRVSIFACTYLWRRSAYCPSSVLPRMPPLSRFVLTVVHWFRYWRRVWAARNCNKIAGGRERKSHTRPVWCYSLGSLLSVVIVVLIVRVIEKLSRYDMFNYYCVSFTAWKMFIWSRRTIW